jgi:hypothetical protein
MSLVLADLGLMQLSTLFRAACAWWCGDADATATSNDNDDGMS